MSKETEDAAWKDGYNAADRGLSDTKNPYPVTSDERLSWNDGYMMNRPNCKVIPGAMLKTNIQIAGMPFSIEKVDTELDVCHNGSGEKLWGQISYSKHSIRILKASPERELRSTLHEVLHGIVNEYRVRELMDDKNDHLEIPIDQLAIGLAEVLESIGITELSSLEDRSSPRSEA
jgi:hypothetical protein